MSGQFQKGNKSASGGKRIGAGRKPDEWKRMFDSALKSAIEQDDLVQVLNSLASQAKAGNVKATALLLAYLAGKPKETLELTGKGGGPVRITEVTVNKHERTGDTTDTSSAPG